jgi:hypothetical protein
MKAIGLFAVLALRGVLPRGAITQSAHPYGPRSSFRTSGRNSARTPGVILAAGIAILCLAQPQPAQADLVFLNVTGNNLGGNAAFSQFNSSNGNGVITVTHSYSAGSPAAFDNINSAIFPSRFEALFPGTGQVQGHLSQMNVNSTARVIFDLTAYDLSSETVFGIWNISDEGFGQPHYRVELIDSLGNPQAPATFNLIGNQDNETQVAGRRRLQMNTATGNLTATTLINGSGVHSDAAFWNNIPLGTQKIIVYGNLPNLLTGDGVGYYFAEPTAVPEPSLGLFGCGIALWGISLRRRREINDWIGERAQASALTGNPNPTRLESLQGTPRIL